MKCVTPMFRIYKIGDYSNGKIVPRSEVLDSLNYNPNYIRKQIKKCNNKIKSTGWQYQQIPCQKCWACKLNYSAEWATRIMCEREYHDECYFITLTYSDENIEIPKIMTDGSEFYKNDGTWNGTLNKTHMSDFIHDLRQYMKRKYDIDGIKYYYCGEYGETTKRPHYHLILMGAHLDPNQCYEYHMDNTQHKMHWKSKEIEKIWKYGLIDVADVEWSSAAYVARYCSKKIFNNSNKTDYAKIGKIPEFVRMSKGIGKKYYQDHQIELHKTDKIIMHTVKGNLGNAKIPRYFDKEFKKYDPDMFKELQKRRQKNLKLSEDNINRQTDMTDLDKLKISQEKIKTKASMLPREL